MIDSERSYLDGPIKEHWVITLDPGSSATCRNAVTRLRFEIFVLTVNRQRFADCERPGDPVSDAGRASKKFEFVDSVDNS
jgi:hypothetical protein